MNGEVVSNKMLSERFGYMEVRCPKIAEEKTAGRFFMISVHSSPHSKDPLLKRPFAICDITGKDTFTFLYMVCGKGTQLLAEAVAGDKLDITGPLGNYFKLIKSGKVALVGGGVGIAPLVLTARKFQELGVKVSFFYGGRTVKDILMTDELSSLCHEFIPVTEDGSLGVKGLVTAPLKERIGEFDKVYACGPNIMLKFVTQICVENKVEIDVSLDEQMGCGVGACLGCMIPLTINGEPIERRCCIEGPVFNGSDVDWARLIR